ncbi:MAG TPA: discoidin domain-containing protein [Vicinamibacterales bacterium]|jgi:F5/8 type C domain-containing protein|nr:discoidin domain-containing protein [Vicinamibacterales bacterium]
MMSRSFADRARQTWTIARIELRRAFFAKRSLWVYALALLPSVIFFGHGLDAKFRTERLARRGVISPALMDSIQNGESADAVKKRLGKPAEERWSNRSRRVRQRAGNAGTTTNVIEPAVEARFVRLNISRPSYSGEPVAKIYEFEVYGPDGKVNLALNHPATGSVPCSQEQGPEKAVNGSVADKWCADDWPLFLQVDLGAARPVTRFIVKHASAGGENEDSDTRDFNIQLSNDGKTFTTVASSTGAGFVEERTEYRQITYFDGRRTAYLVFVDGKLENRNIGRLLDFEEDRAVFAGIFQYFYLRLAVFFGCLGIFMYLFRGEMSNRTLHFWFLAPARRDVLLAGKYAAGLIAAAAIFGGGALLTLAAMIWPHDPVEVQAYWNAGGMGQVFWYAAAAALGCVGYGSVFLAVGLYVRNPIIPAAVLLGWEAINGILPHVLQKMSVLYYLQSLCPVPAPMDNDAPTLIRLLASPAAPASRPGAILGLMLLTGFVLWIASLAVRRMQVSYGSTEA